MLDSIRKHEIDVVVIYKLDRLSRKQRNTMTIIEDVFLKNNIALVSLNETLDTTTAWGYAMIRLLSSFNQMESENIQMRTEMGRKAKASSGGYAGGKPPLGYKAVSGELVVVPEEVEIVRLVFDLRKQGCTLKGIAEKLNEMGHRTKKGGTFLHSAVQNILANEDTYRGHYKYGDSGSKSQHDPILKN